MRPSHHPVPAVTYVIMIHVFKILASVKCLVSADSILQVLMFICMLACCNMSSVAYCMVCHTVQVQSTLVYLVCRHIRSCCSMVV